MMTPTKKTFDLIAIGRAAVDIYAHEVGTRLEDASSFAKYLGGSSANMAYGAARQGLRVSMLTCVGDDHMGRFIIETLTKANVDTTHIKIDPKRLTGLAFLSIKNKSQLPLLFYRKDCADMALSKDDIHEEHIASTRALVLTGTHLSQKTSRAACLHAIKLAQKHGAKVILDIDYRPVLWGLTRQDAGAQAFIASAEVSAVLTEVLPLCDLIVGTEEEICIAGNAEDPFQALKTIRQKAPQAVIITKRGSLGAHYSIPTEPLPQNLAELPLVAGRPVHTLSTVGAGDAFISGLLRSYLTGHPEETKWQEALTTANACGALVVTRHGCAPAIPTKRELDAYLQLDNPPEDISKIHQISHFHRVSTREKLWDQVAILAFDHRLPLEEYLKAKNISPPEIKKRISLLKRHILTAFYQSTHKHKLLGRSGILIDDIYGQDLLNDATGKDHLVIRPCESLLPRPLSFETENNAMGSIGLAMTTWPLSHVVKCLFYINPNDPPDLMNTQLRTLKRLYDDCRISGRELMLEWLPTEEYPKTPATLAEILKILYNYGIYPDWWKLLMETAAEWQQATVVIEKYDPDCRGILLLGAGETSEDLQKLLTLGSAQKLACGFAVGRTVFKQPAEDWFDHKISTEALIAHISQNYETLIETWGRFK